MDAFERLIRVDPGRRGLLTDADAAWPLCSGHLAAAAEHIAQFGSDVAIVTGFYIPSATPAAAENDGPPGAALLAASLHALGLRATLWTDRLCAAGVQATAALYGLPTDTVVVIDDDVDAWIDEHFIATGDLPLSHLIAVERVGPSHTLASMHQQDRTTAAPVNEFAARVPTSHRDQPQSMRGELLTEWVPPLHRLFERLPAAWPTMRTIGIGDGGNEIGMGSILWEELARRLGDNVSARIPCRVPTDFTILAGVSNWGAQALAVAVALQCGQPAAIAPFDSAREQHIMESLAERQLLVDGVTRVWQPGVDGLPFLTYIQPWIGLRRLAGLKP